MPETMDYALELNHVVKKCGFQTPVKGVDLHVPKQSVYCLAGSDSAGKSMLLQLAAGMVTPTEGHILISGVRERKDHHTATGIYLKSSIPSPKGSESSTADSVQNASEDVVCEGLVPEWTISQNLSHMAAYLKLKNRRAQMKELRDLFGLHGHSMNSVSSLPADLQSLTGIAMSFLGWPDLVLLEEPFEYLTKEEIAQVVSSFQKLKKEKNLSIVISTSKVDELDGIADCYGIFINGRLEEELLPEDTHKFSTEEIHLRVGSVKKALKILAEYDCETREEGWIIIKDAHLPVKAVFEILMKNKITVYEIYNHTLNKNEYFQRYKL